MPVNKNISQQGGENTPKKADIILRANQDISVKQDELIRQTKLSNSRIDAALELFQRNMQETANLAKHTNEIFARLENENNALKQELLYLAKQNENIYAGLADKIADLTEQARNRENAYSGLADKVNDLAVQNKIGEETYVAIVDRLTELSEQTKRSEGDFSELLLRLDELSASTKSTEESYMNLTDRIDAVAEQSKRSEAAYDRLTDRIADVAEQSRRAENASTEVSFKIADVAEQTKRTENAYGELSVKLNDVAEYTRRSEGAYLELSDKLDSLSNRVERLGDESARAASFVAAAAPYQNSRELDYEKLADRIAEHVSVREVISPDLIASKVAEQVVVPRNDDGSYAFDEEKIISEVVSRINLQLNSVGKDVAVNLNVDLDEDKIARNVLAGITASLPEEKAVAEPVDIEIDEEKIAKLVSENVNVGVDEEKIARLVSDNMNIGIDEERLARLVANNVNTGIDEERIARLVAYNVNAGIDEDRLARLVSDNVNAAFEDEKIARQLAQIVKEECIGVVTDVVPAGAPVEIDGVKIARQVADIIKEEGVGVVSEVAPVTPTAAVSLNIDEEKIAQRVSDNIKVIDEDKIAQLFADNIKIMDEEKIAQLVADNIKVMDEEKIARHIADIIREEGVNVVSEAAPTSLDGINLNIDEEELADRIALKVGSLKSEDFEIIVDDEGCSSISKDICDRLDYSLISDAVAEKLSYALDLAAANEPDYEEMAQRISEKITVAGINEDAIADKAAAVLSNYLPDFDTDEIADKVMNAVIDVLNAQLSSMSMPAVDNEAICNAISDRIIESQADHDYDIVIDEDGISKITELVAEEIEKDTAERFSQVEEKIVQLKEIIESGAVVETNVNAGDTSQLENAIAEIKQMLESGAVVTNNNSNDISQLENSIAEIKELLASGEAVSDSESETSEIAQLESSLNEIKEMLASGVVVSNSTVTEIAASTAVYEEPVAEEEPLITVSDLVAEAAAEEEEEEEEDDRPERDIDDSDDMDDELMPGAEQNGTDFANMMKYNRSFIARIIQSSDEYKQYYGAVKHALLSYKKVNSNIAWGAERFNKGRETIARFKIRGKTLCLYLALDPNEYKTSVYHHLDATENKSMAGTPMMVKIKSALGVKKAIRLIDEMLQARGAEKRFVPERDYAAMYPYETIEELIEDGIVKDVRKK